MDKDREWQIVNVFLKDAIKLSKETLDSMDSKKGTYPAQQLVFNDFAIRSHCCLEATLLLWTEFADKTFFKLPLAIQLRVGVLDFITFTYLYNFKDNVNDFNREYDRLNDTFYSWILNQAKNFGADGEQEFNKVIKTHFPDKDLLDNNGRKLKTPTVGAMKDISEKGMLGEYVSTAYNTYRLLSQYEHYSIVSRKFMERPVETDMEQSTVAIDCVLLLQYFCFQLLPVDPSLVTRYRTLYYNYLESYAGGRVIETQI